MSSSDSADLGPLGPAQNTDVDSDSDSDSSSDSDSDTSKPRPPPGPPPDTVRNVATASDVISATKAAKDMGANDDNLFAVVATLLSAMRGNVGKGKESLHKRSELVQQLM
jgi:hypothetical protein